MNQMFFGLSITAINWLVLLFVAIFIVGFIKLLSIQSKPKATQSTSSLGNTPFVANSTGNEVSPEVMAAITAAIAAVWQSDTGFTVRHVRRIQSAPAWNRAGREDQVYSRM